MPLVLALAMGCTPDPKSEAAAAQTIAVCVARIQTECKPTADGKKDTACPAYVECKEALDTWENEE